MLQDPNPARVSTGAIHESWVRAVRGDGALYDFENVQDFERRGYTYAISAQRNARLLQAIAAIPAGGPTRPSSTRRSTA